MVKTIAEHFPFVNFLNRDTGVSTRQWQPETPEGDGEAENNATSNPG
jgi:hypothetical protein